MAVNNKLPFSLLPVEWSTALAHLLAKGARKYAPRDFERGEFEGEPVKWLSRIDSLQRHLNNWLAGETCDDETGAHNLVAVAFNALMIMLWEVREKGIDDRPKCATKYLDSLKEGLK
jgi:hypothetical protein